MSLINIDTDKCKRDRICAMECPGKIIEFKDKDSFPAAIEFAEELCIHCGHCVAVCPYGALFLDTTAPEQLDLVNQDIIPSSEEIQHFLKSRRSTRTYKKKPVERVKLQELIDIARYAPTGSNKQQVYWLVIEDSHEVQRLAGMVIDWMRMLLQQNPDVQATRRYDRIVEAWDKGIDRVCRNAPHLIIAHAPKDIMGAGVDCTIALSYLELAAFSMGLGACWAGYLNTAANFHAPLQEALGLPEGHLPYGALMIGHPVYSYPRIPARNPAQVIWR